MLRNLAEVEKGENWCTQDVESAYFCNPYHNSTHAADVVQGLCSLFSQNAFTAQLTDLEMLSMVLSCAIHDVGHPGQCSLRSGALTGAA